MEVSDQPQAPAALPPGKEPSGNHCIGGPMGPRADLDPVAKRNIHCSCQESNLGRPARSVKVKKPSFGVYLQQFRKPNMALDDNTRGRIA